VVGVSEVSAVDIGLLDEELFLIAKINRFTQNYNRNSRPFAWTATADSIFKKLAKLCTRISGTEH